MFMVSKSDIGFELPRNKDPTVVHNSIFTFSLAVRINKRLLCTQFSEVIQRLWKVQV